MLILLAVAKPFDQAMALVKAIAEPHTHPDNTGHQRRRRAHCAAAFFYWSGVTMKADGHHG
jgi:hypothetical protein